MSTVIGVVTVDASAEVTKAQPTTNTVDSTDEAKE